MTASSSSSVLVSLMHGDFLLDAVGEGFGLVETNVFILFVVISLSKKMQNTSDHLILHLAKRHLIN